MGEIADLFASLSLRVDGSSWARGTAQIRSTARGADELGTAFQDRSGRWRVASGRFVTVAEKAELARRGFRGVGAAADKAGKDTESFGKRAESSFDSASAALKTYAVYLGGRFAYDKLIKFNGTVEESRNQIAGMLALTKKTDLNDQLGTADELMANLQKRAATLPGTTAEYVAMLGMITQPVSDAGLGMKDLEDLTVGAVVAAKALSVQADVGARDIDQALRGQFHATDQLTGKLLGARGFKGEEGRERFNSMSAKQRAEEIKAALTQPQIKQLAEAQGKTFSGVLSTLQDSMEQFFGRVGKPLFEGITASIKDLNAWLEANDATIKEVGAAIAGALVTAFGYLKAAVAGTVEVIKFFIDHAELTKSLLIALGLVATAFGIQAAAAWVMATWPILLVVAAITAVVYAIRWLMQHPDKVRRAFHDAFDAIRRAAEAVWDALKSGFRFAFEVIAEIPAVKLLIWLVKKLAALTGLKEMANTEHEEMAQDATTLPRGDLFKKYPQLQSSDEELSLPGVVRHQPVAMSVNVGDINVHAPNADPQAVAVETRKQLEEHLGNVFRRTMGELA